MKRLALGDSLEALIDHRGKTPKKLGSEFKNQGVPVASAILVADGSLDLSEARCVSLDVYQRWMPVQTRRGDVLLTSEAPLGRVARVPTDDPLVLGQRLYGLRGKVGVLDTGFLYYALKSSAVQVDLIGRSTGTTAFGIRQSALREIEIPAPEYAVQQAIADVLGALDDKVATNGKLADAAEMLAKWSIWNCTQWVEIAEVADLRKRSATPGSMGDDLVEIYSLPAYDDGNTPESCLPSTVKSSKFTITEPSVLVSKLNPRFPRVWDIQKLPDANCYSSTEFMVLRPSASSTTVLAMAIRHPQVGFSLESKVSGTSGSHQRVRPVDMMSTEIPDPRAMDESVLDHVTALGEVIESARNESHTLAALRDALLPRLMSGELRVKDAEEQVAGVL